MVDHRAITLTVTGATDVGKKRQRNEDSVRWYIPDVEGPLADYGTVMLVCDGMGGVGQGDVASQTAVEQFFSVYYDSTVNEPDTERRVQKALEGAHNAVREAASSLGRLYIGTTAAGMVMRNDGSAVVFNLGDSRVYRLRGDSFTLISKDQSVNAAQIERGEITPEQAAAARNMNITMFIGHPLEMTPVYVPVRVEPGDVYMLCSDGLWDVLPDAQLKQILVTQPPDQAVKTYIDQTLRAGAPDNVTVIIASTRTHKPRRRWWPFALLAVLVLAIGAVLMVPRVLGGNGDSEIPPGATRSGVPPADTQVAIAPESPDSTNSEQPEPTDTPRSSSLVPVQVLPSSTSRPSQTPTETPPPSATPTDTASATASGTPTDTTTPTGTVTRRPTRTSTSTPTLTPSQTTSSTAAPSATRTASATPTPTRTLTSTPTTTETATNTATASYTPSNTPTATATASVTPNPTATATFTATSAPSNTPLPTSTSNAAFWVLQGTPTTALELVTVARFDAPADEPPVEIYIGSIERRFDKVTETDPLNPGSQHVLVYLRPGVLAGHRFWWLVEDVQPQFEVLSEAGIVVYSTADFAAPRAFTIGNGELVIVTGISPSETWYRIRSRRGSGWVPAVILEEDLVRFIGDIADVPTVFPPPLGQAPEADTPVPDAPPTQDPGGNGNQQPAATQAPPATDVPAPATNVPVPTSVPPTDIPPPTTEPPTNAPPVIVPTEPTPGSATE